MTEAPKTTAVRSGHLFDQAALDRYLTDVLPDFAGPLSVSQFASGQSNPTFLLSTPQKSYVLRKKPPGELLPSAHQVEREYRIMAALKDTGVAVPEVLHLCQDSNIIGTNFFVMPYVEGRIFSHPSLPGLSCEERSAVYAAAGQMLASLHKVDWKARGLSDYGRQEGFVARQVARWAKQYQASKTDQIDEMDTLARWLTEHIPEGDEKGDATTLIHGDFRLDNMIFHPTRPEILAVLDWELSTLGNPLSDLGYFSLIYHLPTTTTGLPGVAGLPLDELGIPTESKFVESYLEQMRSGSSVLPLDPQTQRYFVVFSLFRLAAIAQGVFARARQGVASAANADAVGRMARPCAQLAWSLTRGL